MRAVFLYGPPGVGKLTVGRELAALTGFKLVHNHLSVGLATSVFPFGSAPWGRLLRQIRRDVHAEATRENVDLVITGAVFSNLSEETEFWRVALEPIQTGGGAALFVQLTCDREELFRRVQNESRHAHGKLVDPRVLADVSERSDLFASLPFQPHLRLDSTHMDPPEAARQIATHFSLPLLCVPEQEARALAEGGRNDGTS